MPTQTPVLAFDPVRRAVVLAGGGGAALLAWPAAARKPRRPDAAAEPIRIAELLEVSGAEQPVRLESLSIAVEQLAGLAAARIEMRFRNPNARVLEGRLRFPLAEGETVTGFALDVDGELRDAVPVAKARAEQVFEDITRQRVDPGLLQYVEGNRHELRIYPLPPGGTRTVVLRLAMPADDGHLSWPLAGLGPVPRLTLAWQLPATSDAPPVAGDAGGRWAVTRDPARGWSGQRTAADATVPGRTPLRTTGQPRIDVTTEARGSDAWFSARVPFAALGAVATASAPRPLPRRVQLVWDASASLAGRDLARELALLDAWCRRVGDAEVTLTRVADRVFPDERHRVTNGRADTLRRALAATVHDGASRLSAVRHDGRSEEAFWFTDGLANHGAPWLPGFPVRSYAIRSVRDGNPAALRALAGATGGRVIDLLAVDDAGAARLLLERGPRVARVDAIGAQAVHLADREPDASGHVRIAGRFERNATQAELRLQLAGADGRTLERRVAIARGSHTGALAAADWARLAIDARAADATPSAREEARAIAAEIGIATPDTSLLVLERVEDYVRHAIAPPLSLRAAYDALLARAGERRESDVRTRLDAVARRFAMRQAWWRQAFPKGPMPRASAPLAVADASGPAGVEGGRARAARGEASARRADVEQAREQRMLAPSAPPPAMAAAPTGSTAPSPVAAAAPAAKAAGANAAPRIAIALQRAEADAPWRRRFDAARQHAERLAIYREERARQSRSPGFFLDVADAFLALAGDGDRDSRAAGLTALSNLAELDIVDRQLLRLLAYRLSQAGEHDLAVPLFERVRELAPHEPQSHRDLGLALAERDAPGDPQRALQALWTVVQGAWDARFPDVDLIALVELNALVARARRDGQRLDLAAVDPRLVDDMPLDLRVVLSWDADATDVDLHVIDPNGEDVHYAHMRSYQGGAITRDATGGYGPEEFALRVAKPGRYRVEAEFYGHRQQVLTSRTGLMLWLSSGFGRADQRDVRTTIGIGSSAGRRVVIGEFEVGESGAAVALPASAPATVAR